MNTFRPRLECLESRLVLTSPHFVSTSSSLGGAGALIVTFKEAGLGDSILVHETLTADATAQYQWFNHGGNKPQGQPFVVGPVEVEASGVFPSGKNGNVTGSLTVLPPPPPEEFLEANHSGNWVAHLDVSYTNVVLTDIDNGVSVTLADQSGSFVLT